jgi:hypothetical protein
VEELKSSKDGDVANDTSPSPDLDEVSDNFSDNLKIDSKDVVKCPEILTGECIEDRKSVFQPHFAKVTSLAEVQQVTWNHFEILIRKMNSL